MSERKVCKVIREIQDGGVALEEHYRMADWQTGRGDENSALVRKHTVADFREDRSSTAVGLWSPEPSAAMLLVMTKSLPRG